MDKKENSRILRKIDESKIDQNLKELLRTLFDFEVKHSEKIQHHFSKQYDKVLRESMSEKK